MLLTGVVMLFAGFAIAVAALFAPTAALPGLIGGSAGLGIAGFVLTYLGWPQRKRTADPGKVRATAWILGAEATDAEATGYRMVELTLEIRPEDGAPFQVRRKFVGNRAGFEVGGRVEVFFDPLDPQRVELA